MGNVCAFRCAFVYVMVAATAFMSCFSPSTLQWGKTGYYFPLRNIKCLRPHPSPCVRGSWWHSLWRNWMMSFQEHAWWNTVHAVLSGKYLWLCFQTPVVWGLKLAWIMTNLFCCSFWYFKVCFDSMLQRKEKLLNVVCNISMGWNTSLRISQVAISM